MLGLLVEGNFQRLVGLRHESVVRRDHEDRHIRRTGAARTHLSKRRVTGGIEKSDLPIVEIDLVGPDVLSDSARFTFRHIGFANGIEQRGLSMVDVTQNANHRRPEHQILGVVFYH